MRAATPGSMIGPRMEISHTVNMMKLEGTSFKLQVALLNINDWYKIVDCWFLAATPSSGFYFWNQWRVVLRGWLTEGLTDPRLSTSHPGRRAALEVQHNSTDIAVIIQRHVFYKFQSQGMRDEGRRCVCHSQQGAGMAGMRWQGETTSIWARAVK